MTYIVIYSHAHQSNREIGGYLDLDDAIEAAIEAGASEAEARAVKRDPWGKRLDVAVSVDGHEGDADYAIWIVEDPHRRCGIDRGLT